MSFRPEAPSELPPSYLISADYDGDRRTIALKLYEPISRKIYFWYDDTGYQPYCLSDLPEAKLKKIEELVSYKGLDRFEVIEKKDPLLDRKVAMTKIIAKDPLSIGGRGRGIRDIIPVAWEAHIRHHLNYLYDKQLIPCMPYEIRDGRLVEAKITPPEEAIEITRLFEEEEPEFREYVDRWIPLLQCPIPEFRRAAIDIEVYSPLPTRLPDPRLAEHPVICVSLVDSDGKKRALTLRRPGIKEGDAPIPSDVKVEYYEDEKELLFEVFKALLDYPIVLTFNGDEFDLRYLWHRSLNLGFERDQIPIEGRRTSMSLKYGVHIDLCRFFFNRSVQVYAFHQRYREISLDDVGRTLIGMGKLELEKPVSELSYSELISYCLRDADVTYKLTTFSSSLAMKLIMILSRIAVLPIEDLTRLGISKWIQSLMYLEHRKRGILIPRPEDLLALKGISTTEATIPGRKYKGAIVVEPIPGLHFNVPVLDFASLYPSIIKTWNLSYETILCSHKGCRDNNIPGTSYWVCKRRRGLSSLLIGSLKDLRIKWYKPKSKDKSLPKAKRELYEAVQQALKVILNASYGAFGAEPFAFYCPPVAESTAAIGRYAITETIKKAKSLDINVIYGDTDSIFLRDPKEEQVDELIEWSKSSLKLDLEIDKVYRYAAFSKLKKNYIGVYLDGSVDVKGLTGKKRHVPAFLRRAFSEMMEILGQVRSEYDFKEAKEKIRDLVNSTYRKLKNNEYPPEDLAINVMLGKLPEKYEKAVPQHVRAAFLLKEKGIELRPGDIISFVRVKGEPKVKPVELVSKSEIDTDKYVAYLESAFGQVLDALGLDFHSIIGLTRLEYFLT